MPIKYAHTNLIARDWKKLADFYQLIFDCIPIPPERDLSGEWIDQATGILNTHIRGIHLRLPGHGKGGPTLEIFQYNEMPNHPEVMPNTPGFTHLAFEVEDVPSKAKQIFENGGSAVGKLTVREIAGVGLITFQYIADPEGNIIEIQSWEKDAV